ncbi:hypothetical protein AMECASPLE_019654 [Ameca splendens]|uniref:Vesicle transport protein n=1 Tax=Ameca splendens TaxID=208324 RepID=A0ABV0XG40_9TELE
MSWIACSVCLSFLFLLCAGVGDLAQDLKHCLSSSRRVVARLFFTSPRCTCCCFAYAVALLLGLILTSSCLSVCLYVSVYLISPTSAKPFNIFMVKLYNLFI